MLGPFGYSLWRGQGVLLKSGYFWLGWLWGRVSLVFLGGAGRFARVRDGYRLETLSLFFQRAEVFFSHDHHHAVVALSGNSASVASGPP